MNHSKRPRNTLIRRNREYTPFNRIFEKTHMVPGVKSMLLKIVATVRDSEQDNPYSYHDCGSRI